MNFLSHLYLSGDSEGLLIGNFIADSVKGNSFLDYPKPIQNGIVLHRKIDAFTDSHPVVEHSKQRLRADYHKYAGVITDVYYDHFLANNWHDYSEVPLEKYTSAIYTLIKNNVSILPEKSAMFAKYMLEHNILYEYKKLEGIEKSAEGNGAQNHICVEYGAFDKRFEGTLFFIRK